MSGVEFIVGVVLGSIPIALEVYDRSGRVFEVFSSFKQYPKEVSLLDSKLSSQRAIFRNNVINLLTAITRDRETVLEAIDDAMPEVARLELAIAPVYKNRIDALKESFASCVQIAEQIRNSLQDLYSQFDNFRAELGERRDDISTSEWVKRAKTRFRLALDKPRMEKVISDLREFNRDFAQITDQVVKSLNQISDQSNRRILSTPRPAKSLNMLQRYHRFRYASRALYSTLQVRWNCATHQCHSFDVRIVDSDHSKGSRITKASLTRYVTCELTVTHDGSPPPSEGPLHLEIEQACDSDDEELEQKVEDDARIQNITKVLEINAERMEAEVSTSKKSRAREFLSRVRGKNSDAPETINTAPIPQLPNLPQAFSNFHISDQSNQPSSSASTDLSLVDDVCKTAYQSMLCCNNKSFLGSWNGPHAQWFCVPPDLSKEGSGSWALSEIIRWIAEEPVLRSMPRQLLVELAGNVAEGIMQFYSTPWLSSTADLGQNLRYFSPDKSISTAFRLKGPYFMTRFGSTQGATALLQPSAYSVYSDDSITLCRADNFAEARNQLLFRFGILMLEIGYGRPWYLLKQAAMATYGKLSDYKIAEKLADQLVNQLGLTYPKIIRKCLGCGFGLGETDMDNEDLQRRFVEDVVVGLQQLSDYMVENNIAPLG